ncbi:MAG: hypothetical protein KAH23_04615 [Kiritimatiellae bacterium]|nr:hypothetical protein [Kiritimatiellia bacterium]
MKRYITTIALVFIVSSAMAHHAMEFIAMESYPTAKHGEYVFHLHYDYMVDDQNNPLADHWEFTPGLSYGITDMLMLDLHTHFAKFGEDHIVDEERENYMSTGSSPFMEAAALCLQYRIVEDWIIDIAFVATIEVPFSRADKLLGSEDNVYAGTLILSKSFGEHGNLCANFTYEEEGDEDSTIWAVGVKNPLSDDPHGIAGGVEVMGDFDGDCWSILPGIYAPITNDGIILKTGLEFGQEKNETGGWTDTTRANVSILYRF